MATVLITGATSGIGYALAHHYHAQGARVVLIGRRPLAAVSAEIFTTDTYCQLDLADPDRAKVLHAWLVNQKITALDTVIHNAAVGFVGATERQQNESIQSLIELNLLAPAELTQSLLPFVRRAGGILTYITSVVSSLPGPDYAVYTATKLALEGFARSLRIELAVDSPEVAVQIIRPGPVNTGFHAKSGAAKERIDWESFPSAQSVAPHIASAIASRRPVVTLGLMNQIVCAAGGKLPALVDRLITNSWSDGDQSHTVLEPSASGMDTGGRLSTPLEVVPPSEEKTSPPHCVITGAADGIGRQLALRFGQKGYTITGIDVDANRSMQTQADLVNAGIAARFLIADLARPAEIGRIMEVLNLRPPIDVFIHNAGISAVGPFAAIDWAAQLPVVTVNLTSPLLLTARLLEQRRMRQGATFVYMSSLSHFAGYPGAAIYAATKDGLSSYARSLRTALANTEIAVLTVYPGPTRTAHARRYSPDNSREHRRMAPEKLASQIYRAVRRRQRILVPGLSNRLTAVVAAAVPGLVEPAMRRLIYDRLRSP